jgi:iron complex outermembrane recepter protein
MRVAVCVAATSLVLTAPAVAQDPDAGNSGDSLEQVVVTGSRIARPETEFPSPVVAYGAEALAESGRTNLADFLSDVPALASSRTNNPTGNTVPGEDGQVGINTLNLRNLGENRTLVLVDGRRHVAALQGTSAVDINSIPTDLIERIDVISGGASAVYGADAVSGVVNFITKKNFEGISLRPQFGISERGDAETRFGSIVAGKNFSDGRGNVAIAYEYSNDAGLLASDRSSYRPENLTYFVANPDDVDDDPNIPDLIRATDVRISFGSPEGAYDAGSFDDNGIFVPGAFDGSPDFRGSGAVFDPGFVLPDGFGLGGDGTPQGLYDYPSRARTQSKRNAFNLLSHFDVNPALSFFTEMKLVTNEAEGTSFPNYDFETFIAPDSPFIPEAMAEFATEGLILVERDNLDFGNRRQRFHQQTVRGVLGARGELRDWLSYETSYVFGRTNTRSIHGERLQDRYFAAIDAVVDPSTGQATCRSNLDPDQLNPWGNYEFPEQLTFTPGANSGCLAYNILGDGVADPRAVDWVSIDTVDRVKLVQHVANFTFTGTLDSVFKPNAGSIGFALGTEFRRETSDFDPDPAVRDGLVFYGGAQPASGRFNVKELFAEVNVPLIADAPFAHKLAVGAAARLSNYSSTGSDSTWKFDTLYMPVRGIGLRGTVARAVRAPNIGELYRGSSNFGYFPSDPCDIDLINNGSSFRQENCRSLLTDLGVDDPDAFAPNSRPVGVFVDGSTSGNPDLNPERAKTWTAGIIFDSSIVDNLVVSLDWYDIQLTDAVNEPGIDDLADLCVDQPTLDNPYCPLISREDGTGFIVAGSSRPVNVAKFSTAGADLTVNYRIPTESRGTFNVHVVAGYLHRLTFTDALGSEPRNAVNNMFSPEYTVVGDLTWNFGPLSLNYGLSWWNETNRFSRETLRGDPDIVDPRDRKFKERWMQDLRAGWEFSEKVNVYLGVNNLFDEQPDFDSTTYPVDPLGRYLYAGATVKF